MNNKIIITGGHPSPAIAFVEKIREDYPNIEIIFLGKKFDTSDNKSLSFEYKELSHYPLKYINFTSGRITRILSIANIFGLFGFLWGLIKAFYILIRHRPNFVMSFGSYIALPVCTAAYILHIKVYTHEQTIAPGLSNRIIALFAKKVFISFKESANFFPNKNVIYSGNLLRKQIYNFESKIELFAENVNQNLPCVYITGGSLGSHSINLHVENIIKKLLTRYVVIHQTGDVSEFADFEKLSRLKAGLAPNPANNYILKKHISSEEIGPVYKKANLVICRAGANTVFELVALLKPSILIPLPWSANNEQIKHAEKLANLGCCEIFFQNEKSEKLFELIEKTITNLNFYEKNIRKISEEFKTDGLNVICQAVFAEK